MATPEEPKLKGVLNRSLPAKTGELIKAVAQANGDDNLSDDSHDGRRHTSFSVPRTRFTTQTPHSEREAMQSLRTKITFSDHSTENSAQSTPRKQPFEGAPLRASSQPMVPKSAPSYGLATGREDGGSEGEVTSAVSAQDILAKLDSVKKYLKEAESLHKQLQEKLSEPGASAQVEKLESLIRDLQQQETSYLAVLLRILDRGETFSQLNTTQEEDSGSEFSEDEDSLEGSPDRDHGDSLSLRAQVEQPEQHLDDEDIETLKQKQQVLRDLIQQQEKIKELEEKQAELLLRRSAARKELAKAEAKSQEYQRLTEAAVQKMEPLNNQPSNPPTQDDADDHRDILMKRISALRERKEKLEGFMDSFATLKLEEKGEGSGASEAGGGGQAGDGTEGAMGPTSVDQSEEMGGPSELVNEGYPDSVTELEAKLRRSAEANKKLAEVRQMINELNKEAAGVYPEQGEGESDNEVEGDVTMDSTLDSTGGLDRSLVVQYQQQLARKRQEILELQKQKEHLLQMQERILAAQDKYLEPDEPALTEEPAGAKGGEEEDEGLPPYLALELEKQQQLYNEIMSKTKKLKDLRTQYHEELAKTSEHDTYSLTSSTRLLTDADLTAATWGGSTVQSDESDDDSDNSEDQEESQQARGGSASVQQSDDLLGLPFTVTRHTPRRQPARRTLSEVGDSPKNAYKKRKLEPKATDRGPMSQSAGPRLGGSSQLSAVWPGVIFPSQRRHTTTKDSCTQTSTHLATPMTSFVPPEGANTSFESSQDPVGQFMPPGNMEPQFVFMSNMCAELLRGQNALIGALCQRMDIETSMSQLNSYHMELDAYYRDMCRAHASLEQQAIPSEAEEPVNTQAPPEPSDPPPPSQYGYSGASGEQVSASGGSRHSSLLRPPPLIPAVPSRSPYPPRPSYQPGWYTNPSPMMYPGLSPQVTGQYTAGGMPGMASPFHPWAHFASAGYTAQESPFSFNDGGASRRATLRDSILKSPSGITAASVQVQAPSTPPPSAPPSVKSSASLNNNNNNITSLQVPMSHPSGEPVSSCNVAKSSSGITGSRSLPLLEPTSGSHKLLSTVSTTGTKQEDEESISSMPLSIPDDTKLPQSSSEAGPSFSVFDALRDTIYSEVATLIANNENRPHYLVELFRELQMVDSDYLRQRALYNIQDLVTRVLTGEEEATSTSANYKEVADIEQTASESEVTTEEEPRPPLLNSTSQAYDYVELVQSASSLSTPPCLDQPLASDNLGDTVIKLDKALAQATSEDGAASPTLQPPAVSPGPLVREEEELETSFEAELEPMGNAPLDTHLLDEQIKDIMTEVIPVLKANMAAHCNPALLDQIKKIVLDLVLKHEKTEVHVQNPEFLEMLTRQLDAAISDCLEKHRDKKFKDCGEDMLVDLSEVLFNELSFFSLMQDLRDHPQLSSDFRSVTSSQTTTENEDNIDETRVKGATMDPLLLQALTLQASRTLIDEEEALGKMRDDELAKTWDPSAQSDEDKHDVPKEEAPVSSTSNMNPGPLIEKPFQESKQVVNEEAEEETPPTSTEAAMPTSQVPNEGETIQTISPVNGECLGDKSVLTIASSHEEAEGETSGNNAPVNVSSVEHKEAGNIASVEGIGLEGPIQQQPTSPPENSLDSAPQIKLDVKMKSEQESIEGIPGIIASIEEQGQELAGEGDELPPNNLLEP